MLLIAFCINVENIATQTPKVTVKYLLTQPLSHDTLTYLNVDSEFEIESQELFSIVFLLTPDCLLKFNSSGCQI